MNTQTKKSPPREEGGQEREGELCEREGGIAPPNREGWVAYCRVLVSLPSLCRAQASDSQGLREAAFMPGVMQPRESRPTGPSECL